MQCNDNANDKGEDRKVVEGSTQSSFRNVNQSNPEENIKDRKMIQMSRYCLLTGHAMTRGKELHAGLTSANRFSFTAFILFLLLKTGRILMLIMLLVDSVDDSDNENGYTDIVL